MPIRILIADDHAVLRSGLRAILEREVDIEVVAEAGDGAEAVRLVGECEVDVLILDISMPRLSGAEVARAVLRDQPDLAIVILTMHEDKNYLVALFKTGVRAFVLKKSTGSDLVQAVRAAHRGQRYVDPALTDLVLSPYVGQEPPGGNASQPDGLTPREREVCTLLAYGHTSREVAAMLQVSRRTVESHRANISVKTGVKGRAQLVKFALRHGLLDFEAPDAG